MDISAGIAISLHLFLQGDYNPIHPYAQLEQQSVAAGAYLNSESNVSLYLSKTFELGKGYELEVGAVTGYSTGNVLPMVRLKKDKLFIAPAVEVWDGKKSVGIVAGIQF